MRISRKPRDPSPGSVQTLDPPKNHPGPRKPQLVLQGLVRPGLNPKPQTQNPKPGLRTGPCRLHDSGLRGQDTTRTLDAENPTWKSWALSTRGLGGTVLQNVPTKP